MKLLQASTVEDSAIESILTLYPSTEEDPDEAFFSTFVNCIVEDEGKDEIINLLPKIAEYIFKHESEKRQQIFVDILPLGHKELSPYLKHISSPEQNKAIQLKLAIKFLLQIENEEADETLPLDILEEASKDIDFSAYPSVIQSLPPKQSAAIVNGQIDNPEFFVGFFSSYFEDNDEASIERQKACLQYLKAESFIHINLAVDKHALTHFFKVLDQVTQDAAEDLTEKYRKILVIATTKLYNDSTFTSNRQKNVFIN